MEYDKRMQENVNKMTATNKQNFLKLNKSEKL